MFITCLISFSLTALSRFKDKSENGDLTLIGGGEGRGDEDDGFATAAAFSLSS